MATPKTPLPPNRIYVSSPAEAPPGADLRYGPRGGLFYVPSAREQVPQEFVSSSAIRELIRLDLLGREERLDEIYYVRHEITKGVLADFLSIAEAKQSRDLVAELRGMFDPDEKEEGPYRFKVWEKLVPSWLDTLHVDVPYGLAEKIRQGLAGQQIDILAPDIKNIICEELSYRTGHDYEDINRFLRLWAGFRDMRMVIQLIAALRFQRTDFLRDMPEADKRRASEEFSMEVGEDILSHSYEWTQEVLAKAGVTSIALMRGMDFDPGSRLVPLPDPQEHFVALVPISTRYLDRLYHVIVGKLSKEAKTNPLESWTFATSVASIFAKPSGLAPVVSETLSWIKERPEGVDDSIGADPDAALTVPADSQEYRDWYRSNLYRLADRVGRKPDNPYDGLAEIEVPHAISTVLFGVARAEDVVSTALTGPGCSSEAEFILNRAPENTIGFWIFRRNFVFGGENTDERVSFPTAVDAVAAFNSSLPGSRPVRGYWYSPMIYDRDDTIIVPTSGYELGAAKDPSTWLGHVVEDEERPQSIRIKPTFEVPIPDSYSVIRRPKYHNNGTRGALDIVNYEIEKEPDQFWASRPKLRRVSFITQYGVPSSIKLNSQYFDTIWLEHLALSSLAASKIRGFDIDNVASLLPEDAKEWFLGSVEEVDSIWDEILTSSQEIYDKAIRRLPRHWQVYGYLTLFLPTDEPIFDFEHHFYTSTGDSFGGIVRRPKFGLPYLLENLDYPLPIFTAVGDEKQALSRLDYVISKAAHEASSAYGGPVSAHVLVVNFKEASGIFIPNDYGENYTQSISLLLDQPPETMYYSVYRDPEKSMVNFPKVQSVIITPEGMRFSKSAGEK